MRLRDKRQRNGAYFNSTWITKNHKPTLFFKCHIFSFPEQFAVHCYDLTMLSICVCLSLGARYYVFVVGGCGSNRAVLFVYAWYIFSSVGSNE
ncbi:hypothetical protein K474DRAFT_690054 [Panus rudis PR-1116 ss-1]|nr:hypothetical protein K474DRAFT_690054 [Panus rudis PR-1116 ss-1]